MPEIQKADPAARARLMRFTLVVFLICFMLLIWFIASKNTLINWLFNNLDYLVLNAWIVWVFMLLALSPLFVLAGYLIKLGKQVKQCKRFPLPQSKVARDTIVVSGEAAEKRGKLFQSVGIVLIFLSLIVTNVFKLIFVSLFA